MNTVADKTININKKLNIIVNKKPNTLAKRAINTNKRTKKLNNKVDKTKKLDIKKIYS